MPNSALSHGQCRESSNRLFTQSTIRSARVILAHGEFEVGVSEPGRVAEELLAGRYGQFCPWHGDSHSHISCFHAPVARTRSFCSLSHM